MLYNNLTIIELDPLICNLLAYALISRCKLAYSLKTIYYVGLLQRPNATTTECKTFVNMQMLELYQL